MTCCDDVTKCHHVECDDGDAEDLTENEVTHHKSSQENDWTVVPGSVPRVNFEPQTFDSATRNAGQRQRQQARLTKAAAQRPVTANNRFAPLEEADTDTDTDHDSINPLPNSRPA